MGQAPFVDLDLAEQRHDGDQQPGGAQHLEAGQVGVGVARVGVVRRERGREGRLGLAGVAGEPGAREQPLVLVLVVVLVVVIHSPIIPVGRSAPRAGLL